MIGPRLSPAQARSIADATARINVWDGAVRSGKTIASLIAWCDHLARGPRGPLLMAGKTKDTLERNVIDPLANLFGPLGPSAVVHTRGANTAVILGRLVHVLGAHDAKAEGRLRGITLAGAYVDEASLVPEAFWAQLQARLSLPGARLFATTNPDGPRHWLRTGYLLRDDLELARFRFHLDDNPALDPTYVAHLKRVYTGLWYRRFIDGEWVAAEGAIYDVLDLDRHVTSVQPVAVRDWWLAVDYGTTNPFVALLLGVGEDPVDEVERLWVVREWRWDPRVRQGRRLTDVDYSTKLAAWIQEGADGAAAAGAIRLRWAHVDPAAAHFIMRLHDDRWVRAAGAPNAVVDGIQAVSSLLASDRLRIHESCSGLVDELSGYSWDADQQEKGVDAPLKVDDHGPDALRYGVMGEQRLWDRWLAAPLAAAA